MKQLNETEDIFYNKPQNLQDAKAQAECFSVLGEPGMGKTLTIKKVLSLFPQVIRHTEYQGRPFEHEQIVYVTIESPANNSPRGACLQLLAAVDELLGT
ncbi:MAG: AAA family ATPase, partial [Anaerovoracaceae bacterium]